MIGCIYLDAVEPAERPIVLLSFDQIEYVVFPVHHLVEPLSGESIYGTSKYLFHSEFPSFKAFFLDELGIFFRID